jgi:hypothetical protein
VPRSSGAEGRFGSHAGNRIATDPALISNTRSKVREKDGFLWGFGGASNITCFLSPAACRGKAATMAIQMAGGYATFPSSVPSFGCNLCLAFQVIDDILDVTPSTEVFVREY